MCCQLFISMSLYHFIQLCNHYISYRTFLSPPESSLMAISSQFLSPPHPQVTIFKFLSPQISFVYSFFPKFYLSVFGCAGSSLPCVCVRARAGFLQLHQARASHRSGFSCGAQTRGHTGSQPLGRELSSCGTWVQLLCKSID